MYNHLENFRNISIEWLEQKLFLLFIYELANRSVRKVLFTCVVYTDNTSNLTITKTITVLIIIIIIIIIIIKGGP